MIGDDSATYMGRRVAWDLMQKLEEEEAAETAYKLIERILL